MARRLFIFDDPERFVAGAIGQPGDRTFFVQARKGDVLVSVALEKVQVAALASRLDDLLDGVEVGEPAAEHDSGGLDEPVVELFRVGAMALAWDAGAERVLIEAQTASDDGEYVEVADEETDGPDLLRVRIGPAEARAFVRRAQALVAAGRPACPFCGQPLDPQGHFCTRRNGHLN